MRIGEKPPSPDRGTRDPSPRNPNLRGGVGMKVLPILPVRTGRAADLRYDGDLVSGDARYDVLSAMAGIGERYDSAYFIDLNGYARGDQQIELLKTLCEVKQIWVDPGAVTSDDIIDPLVAGGEWVVMGTSTMGSLSDLEEAVDLSDRLIPAIHWSGNAVIRNYATRHNGIEDIRHHLRTFLDLGLESIIFMDLPKIHLRQGFETGLLDHLVGTDLQVFIAGGINEQDALPYSRKGVSGILLTMDEMFARLDMRNVKRPVPDTSSLPVYEPSVRLNPIGIPEAP